MPNCIACGAELEPPVRIPHTVYVKTLYRIGDQEYCRHHVIRADVAAGIITEVKPSAGPVAAMPRGTSPVEYDRPRQRCAGVCRHPAQPCKSLITVVVTTIETGAQPLPVKL